MKRACLVLLPAMLLLVLAASGCSDDESKPAITRVRATPDCGVAPLQVEAYAAVSGGNETGDPMGGNNLLEVAWNFGDGGTGRTSLSYHRYDTPGEYTVVVTAKDADGNMATTSVPVVVLADSLVVEAVSDAVDGNVTIGQPVAFDLVARACAIDYPTVPGDAVKMAYRWVMNDGSGAEYTGATPTHTFGTAGDYTVDLFVTHPAQAVTRHVTLDFTVSP